MREIAQNDRSPELIETLLGVWEGSVRATHLFLSEDDIRSIREYVPAALAGRDGRLLGVLAVAFMGIDDGKLEMLFVAQEERGNGIGKKLLERGIADHGVKRLDVNEQNPGARGFYEHLGFAVRSRSETDEQGNPFPILHMELDRR